MPLTKKENLARIAARKKQRQVLGSDSDESEGDNLSSEDSGESEVSDFQPSGWLESDNSDNMSDEGARNKKQGARKKEARKEKQDARKKRGT